MGCSVSCDYSAVYYLLAKKYVPRVFLYTISYFVLLVLAGGLLLQVVLGKKTEYVIECFLFDFGCSLMYLFCIKPYICDHCQVNILYLPGTDLA
jgi:hypothetical protein